jgi:hypothetical protein
MSEFRDTLPADQRAAYDAAIAAMAQDARDWLDSHPEDAEQAA